MNTRWNQRIMSSGRCNFKDLGGTDLPGSSHWEWHSAMIMLLRMLPAIPFPSTACVQIFGGPKSNMGIAYFGGDTWENLDAVSVLLSPLLPELISSKICCRSPWFFEQNINSRACSLAVIFQPPKVEGSFASLFSPCSRSACPQAAAKLQRLVRMSLQQWWKALGLQWLRVFRGKKTNGRCNGDNEYIYIYIYISPFGAPGWKPGAGARYF